MRTLDISKVCITLQKSVRLCGFGFRTGVYDDVHRGVFVEVFDLREEPERTVFIYGDLLWQNSEFVDRMRREVMETLGISEEQLLFTASHNHSGPGTGNSFVPFLETADEECLDYLAFCILEAVRQAGENQEEVTLVHSDGSYVLNIFRRMMTKQGIIMRPNYDVEPDRTLIVLSFHRTDKILKGRLVRYSYHANLSKDNELYPDYLGYALKRLNRENSGGVHMFLQGCTADVRSNCVPRDQLQADTKAGAEIFADYFCEAVDETVGNAVGNAVESTVENAVGNMEGSAINNETPVAPGMTLSIRQYRLPSVQSFTKEDMETYAKDSREEIRQWAARVQEKKLRGYKTLEIAALNLGKEKLYFLNTEVFMRYAKFLREQYPEIIYAGYTNGMIGYLNSIAQIQESGYEPQELVIYFALAGTYKGEIQDTIETALVQRTAYITYGKEGETMERGRLTDLHYEEILNIINEIRNTEGRQVLKATHMVANQVKQDKKVFVSGPGGHSNLATMEVSSYAGGLMYVDAVLNQETILNNGALRSIQVERLPSHGRAVVEDYGIREEDLFWAVDAYGVNSITTNAALTAKEKGAEIIDASSREYAGTCSKEHVAHHPSKLNLHDIMDCVVDCKIELGDAMLRIDDFPQKIGTFSTCTDAYMVSYIIIEAINTLISEGVNPPVWGSGNYPGSDEWNNQSIDRFKGRVRRL